jgi:aspartate racemase
MKRIGILGGMSPESTSEYYLHITRTFAKRYGSVAYPEIVIHSLSFQPYVDWPARGRWDLVADGLVEGARVLEAAGVDFLVMATNTMHSVLPDIGPRIPLPILSLPEVVADEVASHGLARVGLLGTRYTMEQTFYPAALTRRGVDVIVPDVDDRKSVDRTIYEELVVGRILESSRRDFVRIIEALAGRGAQGVILGCTEIPLLVGPEDSKLPLFDSSRIHAEAALDFALEEASL